MIIVFSALWLLLCKITVMLKPRPSPNKKQAKSKSETEEKRGRSPKRTSPRKGKIE